MELQRPRVQWSIQSTFADWNAWMLPMAAGKHRSVHYPAPATEVTLSITPGSNPYKTQSPRHPACGLCAHLQAESELWPANSGIYVGRDSKTRKRKIHRQIRSRRAMLRTIVIEAWTYIPPTAFGLHLAPHPRDMGTE